MTQIEESVAPLVASPPAQVATIDRQGYRIGQVQLLSKFEDASELLELPRLFRVPGAPREIVGIANLHGNVVPIFSLHERLQQANNVGQKKMVLVLGHGDSKAGVLIDGLPLRKKFASEQAIDVTSAPLNLQDYAWAAWRADDGVWIEFDYARLLNEISVDVLRE
jgi:twitching motility protein PilI